MVKELTGLGLKEAKDVVDSAPSNVKEGAMASFERILEEAGAELSLNS
jgi:large subunit ribosomal protein L7/L12